MHSWTQGPDHVWSTEMGHLQRGFYNVALSTRPLGQEIFAVNVVATINAHGFKHGELETALRNAWIALRFRIPLVAVSGDPQAGKLYYRSPVTNDRLEEWVDKTFRVMRGAEKLAQFAGSEVGTPDLPTLQFFPATCQLLLHSSHWQVDSHGSLMLLDALLDLAVSPQTQLDWGTEVERLKLPVDVVLADRPGHYSSEVETFVNEMWAKVIATGPDVGLVLRNLPSCPPGRTSRTGITFTKDTSTAFFAACKSRTFTVTEVIQAATIMANYQHAAEGQEDLPFLAWLARDCRNIAAEDSYRSSSYAAHNFVSMHIMPFERLKEFDSLARLVARKFRYDFQPTTFLRSINKISQSMEEIFLSPKPNGYKPASNMMTSSMGVLEKYIKENHPAAPGDERFIAVESIFPATELLSPQTILYLFTWKGCLHLEPVFNEAWYDTTFLHTVLDTVKSILEKELKVKLEVMAE